jgi:hypothetical protein
VGGSGSESKQKWPKYQRKAAYIRIFSKYFPIPVCLSANKVDKKIKFTRNAILALLYRAKLATQRH